MSPVEYYGFSLYFHDAGLFHGDTSLLQNTTAKFSTAILLQHFRNTKILGRPIYQMRKAPGDCPGASFFALYQRISPLHTHLCSLGDEPRGGASLGASLAVQVLQHAPGEADVNAHRRHIHIGRIGKRPRFLPQAPFVPRPVPAPVSKKRKITDSPAVIEGVLSHGQAPVNLCLRRFEKTLDIDFHFHIAIVHS